MARRPTKRENGEGYVELTKSENYACTIMSKYIDPNIFRNKGLNVRCQPKRKQLLRQRRHEYYKL